jgi:hypothetical protein
LLSLAAFCGAADNICDWTVKIFSLGSFQHTFVHVAVNFVLLLFILWFSRDDRLLRILISLAVFRGTRWRSWLRHCATSRKVAGSIPDGVTRIFHWHNPSGRTVALGLTQPLTQISTRNNSWGKGCRCVGLTTLPLSCVDCLEIWEPQPPGILRACAGL